MDRLHELKKTIESTVLRRRDRDGVAIIGKNGAHDPWIFDFRSVMLTADWMDAYADAFWDQYSSHARFQVGCMETAGIALVAAIVAKGTERGTPVNGFFVRKSRKREGLMRQIEGTLTEDPVILVDDIIHSGGTFIKLLAILDDAGLRVTDIFTVLRFREQQSYRFANERDIRISSLFSLEDFGIPLMRDATPDAKDAFQTIWRFRDAVPSRHHVIEKSAPILFRSLVLSGYDDGVFRALDATTGTLVWRFKTGTTHTGKGIFSSPALYKDTVCFGSYDGAVYALDVRTGEERWRYENADWIGSSPAVDAANGRLFIGLEYGLVQQRGGIVALDIQTGAELWRDTTAELTHGSPLYISDMNMVVIGSNDRVLYAYDAGTGSRRWIYETGGDIKGAPAYDAVRGYIAINAMDGVCTILDAKTGAPLFAVEATAGLYSSPLIHGDMLFIASLDKRLYAYDLSSRSLAWVCATGGRIFATPSLFADSLWIGSNDGRLYEIDPLNGSVRSHFQASERIVNAPAFDATSGNIFVGTQANEIYCIRRI